MQNTKFANSTQTTIFYIQTCSKQYL